MKLPHVLNRLEAGARAKRLPASRRLTLEQKLAADPHARELVAMVARGDARTDLGMRDAKYDCAMAEQGDAAA